MGGQKVTRRQKDISRLIREKQRIGPARKKPLKTLPVKNKEHG